MELKVWQWHTQCARIEKAERPLKGEANESALKWCGPYTGANRCGFWLYPPMDVDFIWRGDRFEHTVIIPWENDEAPHVKNLIKTDDPPDSKKFLRDFGGRVKIDFGRVEPNIVQIWTGLSFETPPGWHLLIRSPINVGMDAPYRIQEGVLETDWLRYDIWVNVAVQQKDVLISLRRDQWPPLAQLIPMPKEEQWTVSQELIHRNTPEADKAYLTWADYNWKKYVRMRHEKPKDSGTYFKEKARVSGKRGEEPPTKPQCPFKFPKALPKRLISRKK